MRTRAIEVYSASELRDRYPVAFRRAHERHCRAVADDPAWFGEIADSLKAALKSIQGAPRIDGPTGADDVRRCMAWLENRVLEPLRIGWRGRKRWDLSKYGSGYRPDMVKPCPWTGVSFDEAMIDEMRRLARDGVSPHEWERHLRARADQLCESELEDQSSEESFVEMANLNGVEFTVEGGVL